MDMIELWIARDKVGNRLYLYGNEPKREEIGQFSGKLLGLLNEVLFPEVTFENSPQKIELKLINE